MATTRHPIVTATISTPSVRRGAVASALMPVARRAMPLLTASAGVAIATLAAERALAGLALRTVERAGFARAVPVRTDEGLTRVVVTHTTVVERVIRRG
ncbi:MAG: hypothetical protein WD800_08255 [Dehalococcoidia bacterium]